jgi:hypothetical protein
MFVLLEAIPLQNKVIAILCYFCIWPIASSLVQYLGRDIIFFVEHIILEYTNRIFLNGLSHSTQIILLLY